MNKRELLKILSDPEIPDHATIIVSSDEEGNEFNILQDYGLSDDEPIEVRYGEVLPPYVILWP